LSKITANSRPVREKAVEILLVKFLINLLHIAIIKSAGNSAQKQMLVVALRRIGESIVK